jgi:magnesium/cobalt transport protein CorA
MAPDGSGGAHFHGVSFHPDQRTFRTFASCDLDVELSDPEVFSWVDLEGQDIGILNELLQRFGLDLVLTSHFEAPEVLPRLVERSDCLAFYLYEVEDPERHLDTSNGITEFRFHRVLLVLGADFVITYHRKPLAVVQEVKDTCGESFLLAGKTPGFIAFLFLQRCLYDYAHLNLANDNFLDLLEESLLTARQEKVSEGISVAGQNILTLKKLAASLHIILMRLATKRSPFISSEGVTSFREMLQNALAVRAAVDSSRDLLDGILGSIQARAANRTADVARVLTVLSGLLLPLTVITGIYGMNFENIPETRWPMGYFGVLGLMAVVVAALLLVFRRLGWIGSGRR